MSFSSQELKELITERENALRKPGAMMFSRSRYQIERILGEGGMGITCLADEISAANLKRPVVLKFVKDSLDTMRLDRFLNEVQLSVLFNHPNLVPVYRLESETLKLEVPRQRSFLGRTYEHTIYYAVMQYIDGWNLRQLVDRLRKLNIKLNPDITMFIINRVARGLHYVHMYKDESTNESLQLVHRDISPENILIDRFGRIKVADFGLAKRSELLKSDAVNKLGKMLYSSPEQLDGVRIDHRADIYNIGLLLYFLFTDNDRFGPEWGLDHMRDRIRTKMKKSVLPDLADIDPRLAHICEICLSEDPDGRYQTCEDLATDIDIYFKESQKIVTNEQLEEILNELFKEQPTFTSRRFIPLTGTPHLRPLGYDPASVQEPEKIQGPLPTVKMEDAGD